MSHRFRRLISAMMFLAIIVVVGILGYMFIEKWTVLDSIYMVVITLFTVGFQEVHPLSQAGKIFTIFIIVGGVGSAIYAAGQVMEIFIEGEMSGYRKRRNMDKKIKEMKDHYVISGFGRVGHQVAQVFETSHVPFVVIDPKKESRDELEAKGVPVLIGDATDDTVLMAAGIQRAKCLIACSDSDVVNVYVTLSARQLNPSLNIVARASLKDTEKKMTMAGANRVISPYFISGVRMAAMATQPVAIDFLDLVTHGGLLDFSLFQVTIPTGSPLNGKSIAQADIENASGALVLAIRKSDGSFNLHPKQASQIDTSDVLVVLGTQEQVDLLQRMVQ
ncbi:MAG TPA: potassium channel protein [Terracidiphilus sp.]|nr:potassium channel protein [Terracidiphilus sp.]